MTILPFGDKAREVLRYLGFLTVLEGSVRSMKTVTATWAFLNYVGNSNERVFLLTGNTLGAVSRNVIEGDFGLLELSGGLAQRRRDSDGSHYIGLDDKKIYYGGANDKASFKKFRGLSIGGWYADEINLHDREAIGEFFRRSIASTDRKNIWTLNPEAPSHFIYKDYIDKYLEDQVPGYRYFHFDLDDNPAITPDRRAELENQYSGLFYQRYILGRRVSAEGACYPSFVKSRHVIDALPAGTKIINGSIGSDIGGTGSATAFICSGFFINANRKLSIVIMDELYDNENKSTESVLQNFGAFVKRMKTKCLITEARTDSAEQLIKKSMQNIPGIGLNVMNSMKKPIVDRIRFTDWLFSSDRLFVLSHCQNAVEAFEGAVWKQGAAKEERLDDGTSNIDSLDAFEYSIEPRMRDFR